MDPIHVVEAQARRAVTLLDRVEALVNHAEDIMVAAKRDGKASVALQAIREVRETTRLLGSITGELKPEGGVSVNVLNLQTSEEWQRLRGVILAALVPFPDARVAVAEAVASLDDQSAPKPVGPAAITPYRRIDGQRSTEDVSDG